MENSCPSKIYCNIRYCENPKNRWISEYNCTCLNCLQQNKNRTCIYSGDPYNTDNDCLMSK